MNRKSILVIKESPMIKKKMSDQEWLQEHFEELIHDFSGRYVLIINNQVYPVNKKNISRIEKELREKYGSSPIGLPVPRSKDFLHILKW